MKDEGFIHCSPAEKVEGSANNFFRNENDLVLLFIEDNKVNSKIIWEDLYNTNFNFPHIYGDLNLDAVVKVIDYQPERGR